MKIHLYIYLSGLLIFNMLIFSDAYSQKKDSSASKTIVKINTNKYEFLEGEPIWVEINVIIGRDTTKERDSIWATSIDTGSFLTNYKGDTLKYHRTGEPFTLSRLYYSDTIYRVQNLLDLYGVKDRSNSLMPFYLPEESYKVTILFEKHTKESSEIIRSNTVQFRVRKPQGVEIQAYNEYYKIMEMFFNTIGVDSEKKQSELMEAVNNFTNSHPNSVYFFQVKFAQYLSSRYGLDYTLKLKDFVLNEIKNYPENYWNHIYLECLRYELYKDNDIGYYNFLTNLIYKYHSTILSKFCEEELRWLRAVKEQ